MDYKKTTLRQDLVIRDVISIHYFEYTVDFAFSGELHDFWEIVYADKNELIITADASEILLPQGSLFVHKPMEFHNVRGNGVHAPNSVIVSFSSDAPELYEIAGRVIPCTDAEKLLLGQIIEEGKLAFSTPLGDPYTEELIRREASPFGCEELIGNTLVSLCVSLIRRSRQKGVSPAPEAVYPKRRMDEVRLREICSYLQENVEKDLSSRDILAAFSLSESSLQKLFQSKVGMGAMQYFQRLKIDRAKELIREKKLNFSEISEKLGFSSIHYFSRRFKAVSGMTPSEYAASVKSISL